MKRFELQPGYSISRVIKGGWHLAGGHGIIDKRQAIHDMFEFVEAGITTFDCADIYTGVEELIGEFLRHHNEAFRSGDLLPVQIHTKYVPDHSALRDLSKEDTVRIIDRSLIRLGVERLDLVQFAWWDYAFPNYVDTALHLKELQDQGKIRYIGATNFDSARLKEIVDAGVSVVASQVQYSLLDHRPENDPLITDLGVEIPLLCYGTVAGGFLSNRYLTDKHLHGQTENRSLIKYQLIIEEFGGLELYNELLDQIKIISDKHGRTISEVACQYILQKPNVAGIIVGARNIDHLESLRKLDTFELDVQDLMKIAEIVSRSKGPSGPVFDLERKKGGKHGSIMRYNLNEQRP